jgi:hypothetical protein
VKQKKTNGTKMFFSTFSKHKIKLINKHHWISIHYNQSKQTGLRSPFFPDFIGNQIYLFACRKASNDTSNIENQQNQKNLIQMPHY